MLTQPGPSLAEQNLPELSALKPVLLERLNAVPRSQPMRNWRLDVCIDSFFEKIARLTELPPQQQKAMKMAFLKVFGDDLCSLKTFVTRLIDTLETVQERTQAADEQLKLLVCMLYWPAQQFDPTPFHFLLTLMAHFDPNLVSPIRYAADDSQSLKPANTEVGRKRQSAPATTRPLRAVIPVRSYLRHSKRWYLFSRN